MLAAVARARVECSMANQERKLSMAQLIQASQLRLVKSSGTSDLIIAAVVGAEEERAMSFSPEFEAKFAALMARCGPEQRALLEGMKKQGEVLLEEGRRLLELGPVRAHVDMMRGVHEDAMKQVTPSRVIPNDPPRALTARQMIEGETDISVLPENHRAFREARDLVSKGLGHLTLEEGRARLARKAE